MARLPRVQRRARAPLLAPSRPPLLPCGRGPAAADPWHRRCRTMRGLRISCGIDGAQEHQVQELLKLAPRSTAAPLAGPCSLPVAPVFASPVTFMISLQSRLPSASLISQNRAYYKDSPLHHQVSHNPIFKANKDSFS